MQHLIDVKWSEQTELGRSSAGDEYLAWDPIAGGQQLEKVGDVVVNESKAGTIEGSGSTVYTIPAVEVQWPFASGRSWNGASAYRATSAGTIDCDGTRKKTSDVTQWNLDGSYNRNSNNFICIVFNSKKFFLGSSTQVESDGAASITDTENGVEDIVQKIGVPKRDGHGAYVIPFDMLPSPGPTSIPDWYPGGGLPPSPLLRATTIDGGKVVLPASCNVASSLATSGEEIERTMSRLDPTGEVESSKDVSYYVAGIGLVCETIDDKADIYFVFASGAALAGRSTVYMETSLTSASPQAAMTRTDDFPGALAEPSGALASASLQLHVSELRDNIRNRILRRNLISQ